MKNQSQLKYSLDSDSSKLLNFNLFIVSLGFKALYQLKFETHNIKIECLLASLLQKSHLSQEIPQERVQLRHNSYDIVEKQWTVQCLRRTLSIEPKQIITIDAQILDQPDVKIVHYLINPQKLLLSDRVQKWFVLLNSHQIFSISIRKNITFKQLQEQISDSLNLQKKIRINYLNLTFYRVRKTVLSWRKVNKIIEDQLTQSIFINKHQIIGVQVQKEAAKLFQSQIANEQYLIFHVSDRNKIKLKFSIIAQYKVSELLKYLNIQNVLNCNLGIKIVDQIFPPCKKIKDIRKYFQSESGTGKYVKNLECRLVSEKEMFYCSVQKVSPNFKIEKDIVHKNKEIQFARCQDFAKSKLQYLKWEKKQNFTHHQQIIPITLYSSSVQVIDPVSNQSNLLCQGLKNYLCSHMFGLCDNQIIAQQPGVFYTGGKENITTVPKIDKYHNWKYKFSAKLIKSLEKIEPYRTEKAEKTIVYKFIGGHQLKGQVGQLYIAKQFLSASTNKGKGLNFVKKNPIGTFLQIESLTGRSIKQFSLFSKEEEILFRPYTYFQIVEKDPSGPIFKIKLVQLPAKQYKSNPATIILWVDDKPKEGQKVIASLQCPMHTTFLHQLMSTRELDQWISKNQQLVQNPKIKKVLITNMKRKQEGIDVFDAGIRAFKMFKSRISQGHAAIYYCQGIQNILSKSGINVQEILICKNSLQLQRFIASVAGPCIKETKEEIVQEASINIQKLFEPLFDPIKKQNSTLKQQILCLQIEKRGLLELNNQFKNIYQTQMKELQKSIKKIQHRIIEFHNTMKQTQQKINIIDNIIIKKRQQIFHQLFQSNQSQKGNVKPQLNQDMEKVKRRTYLKFRNQTDRKVINQASTFAQLFNSIKMYEKHILKIRQKFSNFQSKYLLTTKILTEKNKILQEICNQIQGSNIFNISDKMRQFLNQYNKYKAKYSQNSINIPVGIKKILEDSEKK